MKTILINTTAVSGSIGKIAYGHYDKLKSDGNEVRLYYGRNDMVNTDDIICFNKKADIYIHAFLARLTGLHGYFSSFATNRLIKEIEIFHPDIVQLYNLHGYYLNIKKLFKYLGKKDIPVVYSMLDEYPYLGRCCYSFECNNFMRGCRHCRINRKEYPATWFFRHSNKFNEDKRISYDFTKKICFVGPKWVLERAKTSNLLKRKKMFCVDEWIDTEKLFYPRKEYKYIGESLKSCKKKIVLTVAPYSNPRKGGRYFIELAKRYETNRNYIFIYVGMDVKGINVPDNCIVKGFVRNQEELAEYYSIADVFVCTSLADTMPNVCLDALACGTPLVGFRVTGIPYVADEPIGKFVAPGNVDELAGEIEKKEKKTQAVIEECRDYAMKRYSLDTYYEKMKAVYRYMLQEKQ